MTRAWLDMRKTPDDCYDAVRQAGIHARVAAIVDTEPARLAELPPTVLRVYSVPDGQRWRDVGQPSDRTELGVDLMLIPVDGPADLDRLDALGPSFVADISVTDQASLALACRSASSRVFTVVSFADPTRIPLEIVIAAADKSSGELVCQVASPTEAAIVLGVLEKGSEAILYSAEQVNAVIEHQEVLQPGLAPLKLSVLTVDSIAHVGMGDRVCVDTCSQLEPDEGILVGSFAHGFILCCSETHPLPYMPTRPFRVNAGALHSYVLRADNRTNYLSELHAGMPVLAVRTDGSVRTVVVGRTKLERRPLLQITAHAPTGEQICLTVQDDWHVRVLGPEAVVRNVTELCSGSELLGYLATDRRHVGYPVDEFCVER
ncbi:MAG TPA: 3-dehydroquinate synthase II family protein [Jatrophihabitans sp.]|nr:3-dehydroquinate synthase II family protein [Jatrophihabitans sp.]